MITFRHTLASLLAGFALTVTGCTSDMSSSQRAIIQSPCASNADCPANFECEIEIEHGKTTSFCQSHHEDATCPAGFELEVEHGQAFCKPHDRGVDRGTDDRGTDDRGADDRGTDDRGTDDRGTDDHSNSGHR